jgi:large subunit ribosomal protein L16
MGRGKGAVDHWVCCIKPGRILFEVKSKDLKIVEEALLFCLRKIPFHTQLIKRIIKL